MSKKFLGSLLVLSLMVFNFSFLGAIKKVEAASLTGLSDTVNDLTTGIAADQTIVFTSPTGIAAGATLILTFDNGTNTGSVAFGDVDLQDDSVDVTLAATASGSTWGFANTSSTVLTFTNGTAAVVAGSVITIKIGTNATSGTNQITNGTAGTTVLDISGGFGDTGSVSMAILANGVVSVSAKVLSSISFAISANTISFGNLSSSTNCYAQTGTITGTCTSTASGPFTLAAGTNASTGYTLSVQGATLTSGANDTIAPLSVATVPSAGTAQFGLNLAASGGSGVISSPYGTSGQYAYTATASTSATIATSPSASATTTYTVNYLANIAALTPAGTYTTAHTYVATGNF